MGLPKATPGITKQELILSYRTRKFKMEAHAIARWGTGCAYWGPDCPVKTDSREVMATAYVRPGKTLIALGNWGTGEKRVRLELNWQAIGLDPAKTPPYFGNGAIVYEPVAETEASVFDNMLVGRYDQAPVSLRSRDSEGAGVLIYQLECPYILSGAILVGSYQAHSPGAVVLSGNCHSDQ